MFSEVSLDAEGDAAAESERESVVNEAFEWMRIVRWLGG